MTPIGLDLSLTSTGVACRDIQMTFSSKKKGMERIHELRELVLEFVKIEKDPLVMVEGYSFGSKNSQAHALGELGGVVRYAFWKRQIPWIEIAPTVRSKFATGRGNAGKNEVVSAISARTGIVWDGVGGDDRCDAWILEECGRAKLGSARYNWPHLNLSALDKVDWSPLGIT